ncbi:MAG: hypothetical protein V4736_02865 [Bdellovibrionota bacterium]
MIRSMLLISILAVTQISSVVMAAPDAIRKAAGTVDNLDAGRVDFTLFVKLSNSDQEFRVMDTNSQKPETEKIIKVLQKAHNANLEGTPVKIEIQYNQDLVITSAGVKN